MTAPSTHLHIFELEKPVRVVTDVRQIDLTKLEESGKLLGIINFINNKPIFIKTVNYDFICSIIARKIINKNVR